MTTVLNQKVSHTVKLKSHLAEAVQHAKRIANSDSYINVTDTLIDQVSKQLVNKLSFNNKTGVLKYGVQIIASPAKGESFTPYEDINDLIEWEFAYEILAEASRIINTNKTL